MDNEDLTRRALLKIGAAATLAAAVGTPDSAAAQSAASAPAARRFFTPEELALVDELGEMILPADGHSPGARAANVAEYIDARLAEAFDAEDRTRWRDGLELVNELSRTATGRSFLQASAAERLAVLTRMSQNEARPQAPEEVFFRDLKARVVHAYYTSEIGIRQDLEFKGNTYLAEFAGVDVRH